MTRPASSGVTSPVATASSSAVEAAIVSEADVIAGSANEIIELLRKGKGWWQQLQSGQIDIATIAREEKVNDSWVSRLVRLNFLAPPLVEAILAGTQPASISAASLRTADLPIDWKEQLAMFGI